MGLEVLWPGHFTTIQDRGRPGYAAWGVPAGGAFDRASFDLANALLANPPEAAALEMTLIGGDYRARAPLAMALAGAPMTVSITSPDTGKRLLEIPAAFSLLTGETLRIGGTPTGARTYLAVRGGWQTPQELESRSSERPIVVGQILEAAMSKTPHRRPKQLERAEPAAHCLRIIDGPDYSRTRGFDDWLQSSFIVGGHANRMGLRIDGPSLWLEDTPERLSMPVAPGAMQVAGGQLIILGVACGTIGGYPHVAHVITADLDRLGQLRPGDPVRFLRIDVDEARRIGRENRLTLQRFCSEVATAASDILPEPSPD